MKPKIFPLSICIPAFILLLQLSANAQSIFKGFEYSVSDPIFTTYAAATERSDYKTDQAYELMWTDPEKAFGLKSRDGGEIGLCFSIGQQNIIGIGEYYKPPVISASYSDMMKASFQPVSGLKVDASFCVYSSNSCILEYTLTNTGSESKSVIIYPYFYRSQGLTNTSITDNRHFRFNHHLNRDGWMKDHQIPFNEDYINEFILSSESDSQGLVGDFPTRENLGKSSLSSVSADSLINSLAFQKRIILKAGESTTFRVLRIGGTAESLQKTASNEKNLMSVRLDEIIKADELAYSKIPIPRSFSKTDNSKLKDQLGLYYSAFSLMRQCIMPPEGKCHYNYYVFSREPKWGWGYGGQVFHESLSMLAYMHMDPKAAMNSQRVFMERQHPDGYINYRTGPYLDETIPNGSMNTSSAPWFSYTNYEIYKLTKDPKFLYESYESGRKLYGWFMQNRDKDEDGLYEWGGDATLECVRDGLVATWDKVSKPENLEGPDLNSMMVREALSLSFMASDLKMEDDARKWHDMARKLAGRVNKQLWDSVSGFYYNTLLSTNGFKFLEENDLKIKEIVGFLPLWANIPSRDQAAKLIQSLYNPEEFWRPYGIPTLSAKDSFYNPMGYWNGPVWVQWQFLIYRGLKDYGYDRLASQLTEKLTDQMSWHLKNDHTFWEFYSPDKRQAGWNKTYIWAGIIARMMLEE
ncbi:MAG: hypothetical protein IPH88_05650 [Bacteroidales bacterium]|nr:hypothetical protein [Bacteroidales bacterium]